MAASESPLALAAAGSHPSNHNVIQLPITNYSTVTDSFHDELKQLGVETENMV